MMGEPIKERHYCRHRNEVLCPDCGAPQVNPVLCRELSETCEQCGRAFVVEEFIGPEFVSYQLGCCQDCGNVVGFNNNWSGAGHHRGRGGQPCKGIGKPLLVQPANPPTIQYAHTAQPSDN